VTCTSGYILVDFKEMILKRKIFGAKSEEVRKGWRRMDSDELRDLSSSTNITGSISVV